MGIVNELKLSYLKQEDLVDRVMKENPKEGNKIVVTKDRLIEEIGKKIISMSPGSKSRLLEKIKGQ